MNNCPRCPKDVKLHNIEFKFLSANTTSKLQPLDQGIIRVVKQYYCERLVLQFIKHLQKPGTKPTDTKVAVTALDSMHFLSSAWEAVTAELIANCFKKARMKVSTNQLENDQEDFKITEDDNWKSI